ncbi:hypothetical protein F4779DRAFT_559198 [Xylariaceae sp. FL0662B]|nr:hypothetical protein F4779DRAFT_559198 [Xylariaceae sp. FL0662B]
MQQQPPLLLLPHLTFLPYSKSSVSSLVWFSATATTNTAATNNALRESRDGLLLALRNVSPTYVCTLLHGVVENIIRVISLRRHVCLNSPTYLGFG